MIFENVELFDGKRTARLDGQMINNKTQLSGNKHNDAYLGPLVQTCLHV